MKTRKRYALVGTGGRASMVINAVSDTHKAAQFDQVIVENPPRKS